MEIQIEKLHKVIAEVYPLLQAHYEEVAVNKEKVKLSPDLVRYLDLEECGQFVVFTLRKDGELIGYNAFILTTFLHNKNNMLAQNDVLYIKPEYRHGSAARRLMKAAEEWLIGKVDIISYHSKVDHDFSPLLERDGYDKVEYILMKEI